MERFGDFQKLKVKSVEFLKKTPHTWNWGLRPNLHRLLIVPKRVDSEIFGKVLRITSWESGTSQVSGTLLFKVPSIQEIWSQTYNII